MPVGIYVHGARPRRPHRAATTSTTWATTTTRSAASTSTRTASPSTATTRTRRSATCRSAATRSTTCTSARARRVVVNGNVNDWSIVHNHIHDNDNIGIDAIGFEPTLTGKYRYTRRNRARNGVIAGNIVARIRSRGNPAYWEDGDGATAPTASTSTAARTSGSAPTASPTATSASRSPPRTRRARPTTSASPTTTSPAACTPASRPAATATARRPAAAWRPARRTTTRSPTTRCAATTASTTAHPSCSCSTTRTRHLRAQHDHRDERRPRRLRNGAERRHDGTGPNTATTTRSAPSVARPAREFGWRGHMYNSFAAYRQASGQDAHSRFR